MLIDESNQKKAVGTVSPTSELTDPHVQRLIKYIATSTKKKVSEIEAHLNDKVNEMKDLEKKAPILYHSMVKNAIEAELNKLFDTAPKPSNAPEFDPITFSSLIRRVKAENPSIFPLRNFIDRKPIASPRIVLVPSKDPADKHFNDISTAAATPNGEFIFSVPFMQQMLNFAHVKQVQPKSKKYKNNGGDFEPEWSVVEFLILHEFFHYTHADFHYQKVLKADPTIINWVGDFRSNYDLIKAGHEPIAMGLYNDLINYDRQKTYREMYDLVKSEFDKLSPKDKQRVEDALGDLGDEHQEGSGEGSGAPGPDDEQDGKEQKKGKGKGDEEGEGKGKKPGEGEGETPSEEELEEHSKRVSEKAKSRQDGADSKQQGDTNKPSPSSRGGRGAGGPSTPTAVDYASIRPRYDWKTLLARLVKAADTAEITYQKVHRRNITSIHVATQTGAGVIRPGEKEVPSSLIKLCIVVDSSGSMANSITTVLSNVQKLLTDGSAGVARSFAFIEFSSDYKMYSCTMTGKSGTAREIKSAAEMKNIGGAGAPETISAILGRHSGGATNFSEALVSELSDFANQNYNILILTDTDIVGSGNKEAFLELYGKHHSKVYLILDSKQSFTSVVASLKSASANISHL